MRAGKVALLVVGIILLLISLVPFLAGIGLMFADKALKGPDGFYSTPSINIKQDSFAIVTEPAHIDVRGDWKWPFWLGTREPGDLLSIKVEGSSNDSSKGIFIGVAPASDLRAYLDNVAYDELTGLEIRDPSLGYTNHPGTLEPEAPATQTFWVASAHGKETQALRWAIEEGTYSFVLMNENGSRGINLSVSVGAKIPAMIPKIGTGLIVGGLVVLAVAILLLVLAVRKPRTIAEQPGPM